MVERKPLTYRDSGVDIDAKADAQPDADGAGAGPSVAADGDEVTRRAKEGRHWQRWAGARGWPY